MIRCKVGDVLRLRNGFRVQVVDVEHKQVKILDDAGVSKVYYTVGGILSLIGDEIGECSGNWRGGAHGEDFDVVDIAIEEKKAMKVGKEWAVKGWIFGSSSSDAEYETLKYPGDRTSCNCPGWTRRIQPDGSRACKHTRWVTTPGDAEKYCIRKMTREDGIGASIKEEEREEAKIEKKLRLKEVSLDREVPYWVGVAVRKRVNKIFADLRSYGFIAYQGIMHTVPGAENYLRREATKKNEEGIPVAGRVWTDRDSVRRMNAGADNFDIFFRGWEEVDSESVAKWLAEICNKNGMVFNREGVKDGCAVLTEMHGR